MYHTEMKIKLITQYIANFKATQHDFINSIENSWPIYKNNKLYK